MKTLHVMDLNFNYKAALKGYETAIIKREWNSIGSFDLVISSEIPNADLITEDDLLWFNNEYHKVFIVERIESSLEGGSKKISITATHINGLLRDFITLPPSGLDYDSRTGTREQIVRAWVDQNAIHPEMAERAQYAISLGTYGAAGAILSEQTRHKNLAEEISRVLSTENLGWVLTLDIPNKRFVFTVLQGTDRTAAQSTNNRILFGLKYGNISGYRKVNDALASKTVAIVGGKGEGAGRTIIEIDGSGLGRRKEIFVDARDIDVEAELTERGYQALSDLEAINSFEFETIDRQFIYEKDYDLGDFVTVVIDKTDSQDLQIQKITEIYEKNAITVRPEFGRPERTLKELFSGITKRLNALEGI